MNVLTELRFNGGAYHGWQVQKNAPSVQKCVQNAAEALFKGSVAVTGCSRTDAGVHAKRYFCTLKGDIPAAFPIKRLPEALNCLLPDDVAAVSAALVNDSFHPRYDARAKEYEYLIYCGKTRDPFYVGRAYMLPGRAPDTKRMNEEAQKLLGRHDFSSFCASGGKIEDKTRTVFYCGAEKDGDLITIRICADGFLYNMVRIIAGTLYECGIGGNKDLFSVLAAKNRSAAGRTAPPEGLYLTQVFYDRDALEKHWSNVKNRLSDA